MKVVSTVLLYATASLACCAWAQTDDHDLPHANDDDEFDGTGMCREEFECKYQHVDAANGKYYGFDLRPLCQDSIPNMYKIQDESGHTYRFNICGDVGLKCAPKEWVSLYDHGSAMQTWGDVPECDMSDPTTYCTDIEDGQAQCCSSPCQILGIGEPYFELLDRKNPETGGIRVLHQTVPAHADDPYNCPYDPDTGGFYQREMKIEIRCNSKVAGLQVQSVTENPNRPCSYTIGAQSKYGCGAKVTSAKPAKSGGKVAGAFFGGVFATLIVGAVGFYVYQRQQMGLPLLPFDNAPIGSGAAGSGSGSGSSSGAPDASFTGGAGSGGGEGAAQAGTYSSL